MVAWREAELADATIARRFRSLQQLFKWLADEDEIDVDPMARMKPPKVVDQPPRFPTDAEVAALLDACRSNSKASNGRHGKFERDRDVAIVLILNSTGIRVSELVGIGVGDVHLDASTFTVTGKGGRLRVLPLLPQPAEALDRYMRARRRHPKASEAALWLGEKGRLTDSGVRQMLERRSIDAGIARVEIDEQGRTTVVGAVHPHAFRHRWAHLAKTRGLSDENTMALGGWQTSQMLQRYGRAATAERARAALADLFGEDRL